MAELPPPKICSSISEACGFGWEPKYMAQSKFIWIKCWVSKSLKTKVSGKLSLHQRVGQCHVERSTRQRWGSEEACTPQIGRQLTILPDDGVHMFLKPCAIPEFSLLLLHIININRLHTPISCKRKPEIRGVSVATMVAEELFQSQDPGAFSS